VNNSIEFQIAEDNFKNNKISTHTFDIPFELRWRTSTLTKYKFWRFYAGSKLSYIFASNSKFKGIDNTIKINGLSVINHFQYGLTAAVGFGTWNFNFYYALSDMFSNAQLNEITPLNIREYRIGLIFYIL
jgi:hypothetical protein